MLPRKAAPRRVEAGAGGMTRQLPCATCPACPDGRLTLELWVDYNLWSCTKCGRRWRLPPGKRLEGSRPLTQKELREDIDREWA